MVNETQKMIIKQCGGRRLIYEGFKFVLCNAPNVVGLALKGKRMYITLNEALDEYDIELISIRANKSELHKEIYCDQLIPTLNNFFKIQIPELQWVNK